MVFLLWFIAILPDKQGMGYGNKLLKDFEEVAKLNGVEWVFLNATKNSTDFYKKAGYITSETSTVYEYVKTL